MVSSVSTSTLALFQGQTALALLTGSSSTADSDAVLSAYEAQTAGSSASSFGSAVQTAPTAPWASSAGTPTVEQAVQSAVNGQAIVNPGSAQLDAPAGVSTTDYKNLFAVYQGLNSLYDLASTAAAAGTSNADPSLSYIQPAQLQSAFASGMSQ